MDSDTFQVLQKELTCSICMNYFLDPVTLDCGHSFCRPCLFLSWDASQTPMCCPHCRQVSKKSDLKTNTQLRNMASLARQARIDPVNSSQEQICEAHDAAKWVFCDTDRNLLCGLCSDSLEHMLHSHRSTQRAAEEFREKLLKRMGSLWNMTKQLQSNVKLETSKAESLEEYVALRKAMIKAEYQKIHQFLFEEEHLHLHVMEKEAKEIYDKLEESRVRMTQQIETQREMFTELKDMCQKSDVELLQDLGTVMERTELVQNQTTQPVNPDLTSWCSTGLLDMLSRFKVDNVLHPGTIGHLMSLSEDVKGVLFGNNHHSMSREPQRVRSLAAWGNHTFISGRHYWEVDVPRSSSWVLGVCKDVLIRENDFIIDFEEASLLFALKLNDHYYLSTNRPLLVHHVKMPVGKIGVFLDYDKGTVSFHDAADGSLLCSLTSSTFSFPLKPFRCVNIS
ncbi:tripartite motif-containing protein 64-like [Myotis daubentonii]|uniref:tripartite motif-containing protein 64-like n=1 Tax=Myotis daubentonii TaxID=98922 RepID=UPI0028736374|nr:tripartite motif-containing protein 64-like [Myotis daubentonii]